MFCELIGIETTVLLVPPSPHIRVDEGLASEEGFDNDGKNYMIFTVCNLFVNPNLNVSPSIRKYSLGQIKLHLCFLLL